MDFELSEEQVLMRDTVARFLDDNLPFEKRLAIVAGQPGYKQEHWEALAELGILALPFSDDAGGLGGGAVDTMIVMEQMGRALMTGPYISTVLLAGKLLERVGGHASDIESVIEGSRKVAFACTERSAGHNVTGTMLTAEKGGDGYVLRGEKCAVFHADTADDLVVLARTSGEAGEQNGLSLFMLAADTDGVTMSSFATQDGNRAADVTFEGVQVPANALLGEEGAAFDMVECLLDEAASAVVGEAVGIMWAIYDMTLEYMKTRTQFGETLGSFQALQHRMVDMYMMCEMAQSMAYDAAAACDGSDAADRRRTVSAAKSLVGRYGRNVGQEGIQLHGAIGMTMEVPVGHYFKRLCMIDASFGDVAWHEARHAKLGR